MTQQLQGVAALDREVAELQAFDHDRALTHYRGLLGRLEDDERSSGYAALVRAAARQRVVSVEDDAYIDSLDDALGQGRR